MGPKFLADLLKNLPSEPNPNLLVGFETSDDAGIFRIDDRQALVQTVDFFPPILDDPYAFGQVAAANALSDIYAMGGKPLTALNIVGFPEGTMPPEILSRILLGGAEKIREAGAVIVGGHSIKDKELKYGVAVTGIIDIDKIIRNVGAKVGDRIFLTKPLGTGLITTAIKKNLASPEDIVTVTVGMTTLNNVASELMVACGAHAATDITGFGLLGHAYEMAHCSDVTIRFYWDKLPLLPNVIRFAEEWAVPGGTNANIEYMADKVQLPPNLTDAQKFLLHDPQTSGGLLIALSPDDAAKFSEMARKRNLTAFEIGDVINNVEKEIIVEL
ncbi:Selenide, water dikinase [Candidatus Zixiibacteriota bacterium]|nr:Selenide, water dikinase [candidate division Zixibacteria bacterium]